MFMKEMKIIDSVIDAADPFCVDVWSKKTDEDLLILLERLNRERKHCINSGRDVEEVSTSIKLVEALMRKRTLTVLSDMNDDRGGVVIV